LWVVRLDCGELAELGPASGWEANLVRGCHPIRELAKLGLGLGSIDAESGR
jgi:hypothetical protein